VRMKALCGAVGVAVVRLEEAAWRFLAALCDGEPLLWQPASINDNNGCSKGLRSNSFTGSLAPSNTDLRAGRATS